MAGSAVSSFQFSAASLQILCARPNSESLRHLSSNNALKRHAKSSSTLVVQGLLDKCMDFGQSSRKSWASVEFPSIAARRGCAREEEQAAHPRCPTVHSGQPIVFSDEQQARPPGGSPPARPTTASHNNEITKGGAWDE